MGSKVNVLGEIIHRGAFAINAERAILVTKIFFQKSFSRAQQPETVKYRLNMGGNSDFQHDWILRLRGDVTGVPLQASQEKRDGKERVGTKFYKYTWVSFQ